MGWGNCGTDSNGRPIGYVHEAECDHPDCSEKIDRGLSYVCGDMHGEDEVSCERYFCAKHRQEWVKQCDGRITVICDNCAKQLRDAGEWHDSDEGYLEQEATQ